MCHRQTNNRFKCARRERHNFRKWAPRLATIDVTVATIKRGTDTSFTNIVSLTMNRQSELQIYAIIVYRMIEEICSFNLNNKLLNLESIRNLLAFNYNSTCHNNFLSIILFLNIFVYFKKDFISYFYMLLLHYKKYSRPDTIWYRVTNVTNGIQSACMIYMINSLLITVRLIKQI